METKSESTKSVPPYLSYKTLQGFIQSLSQGVPAQIDRSLMPTMSGTVQQQLLGALRYLRLTDQYGNSSQTLEDMATSTEGQQKVILQHVLKEAYPFLFDGSFSLERATPAGLDDRFRAVGASGDTIRKCVAFFLAAAQDADVKLSAYLLKSSGRPRGSTSNRSTTKPRARKPRPASVERNGASDAQPAAANGRPTVGRAAPTWTELLLAKFPELDPQWPDEVKSKWFDSFRELMQMQAEQESGAFADE